MNLDSLKNDGMITTLTDNQPGEPTTIVVVGVPRSGTSMVGAALQALGVFIGDEIDTSVFEDRRLFGAFESGNEEEVRAVVSDYNSRHATWGFKRPKAFARLDELLAQLRNPRLIVTFRDPVAIAVRNSKSVYADPIKGVRQSARAAMAVISAIEQVDCPAMLVSYEKAMSNKKAFIRRLTSFCGLPYSQEVLEKLRGVMTNGPEFYLSNARLIYEGEFSVKKGRVEGWIMTNAQTPTLGLFKDGEEILTIRPKVSEDAPEGVERKPGFQIARFDEKAGTRATRNLEMRVANTTFALTKV